MRKVFILFMLLETIIPIALLAQYSISTTPAEFKLFKEEITKIIRAGYTEKEHVRYQVYDGKVHKNSFTERVTVFNKNATIKEKIFYNKTGRSVQIHIYKYKTNGTLERITKFHPTGEVMGRVELRYNFDGFLLNKIEYDQYNYVINKVIYTITNNQNTIKETHYYSPDLVTKTFLWYYSNKDKATLAKVEEFKGEDLMLLKRELKYKEDKITQEFCYNGAGALLYFLDYTYNTNGKLVGIKKNIPRGGSFDYYTARVNEMGLKVGEIQYKGKGNVKSYYSFRYR